MHSCTHVKTFLSLKIEFEIQHTAHTMDCNNPDLEAFESNLHPIALEIELLRLQH